MAIKTTADIVRTHGAERPERVAMHYGDATITWADLDASSSQVAQGLQAAGVGNQDHIALIDKNGPEYFEILFGGAKLNAITVAINWRLAPPEMAYIVNDAQAKVLFVAAEFVAHLDKFESELTTVEKIVIIGDNAGHPTHGSYAAWRDSQKAEDPGVPSADDDVAMQLYTSGTTGLPKGVMLTNHNLFALVPEAASQWEFTPDSVNLVAMPLFHIGGSGYALVGMFGGGESVLLREVDPARILQVIPQHGITNAFLVPAVLQFLLITPGVDQTDFSTLRMIAYGASPITDEVLKRSIQTFGAHFYQLYGLTETTGAVTQLGPEDHGPDNRPELLRSCGKPFPWVELRVVDPETNTDQPVGKVGELWVRTSQNMKGYWNHPEETAKTKLPDGWLRTGDAGYLDDEGFVYLYDRVKDMIVSGGENVYPAEVENVLMSHPGVADVAVIGVPHEKGGETGKAIVVKAEGEDPTPEELIAYCRERLATFKCPTSVEFTDVLPRNPSGKLLKRELREPYWEGQARRIG